LSDFASGESRSYLVDIWFPQNKKALPKAKQPNFFLIHYSLLLSKNPHNNLLVKMEKGIGKK